MTGNDTHNCPICAKPFKPDDICASDITEGTCHAACLEGSPVVDLETGEKTSGKVDTYPYSEVMDPAPQSHLVGVELPADVIESLLAIGPVEWGVSFSQSDERHASDLLDTLRITREHFGITDEETGIHGVYLEGTNTVLVHTGMSPNSPQNARILVGAWNQLVEIARARATTESQP